MQLSMNFVIEVGPVGCESNLTWICDLIKRKWTIVLEL